jgi:hypothetical protein
MGQSVKIIVCSALAVLIIAINNTLFYDILRKSLEKHHQTDVAAIAKHIQNSIEQSRLGAKQYEDMIGQRLRADAIAIQRSLPPKIEDVKIEDLIKLKSEHNLQELSLLIRTPNDIVVEKSTSPSEIGLSTKTWGLWYKAFMQLFDQKDVSLDWGQKLPNFWSGPYEVAASDNKTIFKWGYYYDGTTDYIVDPFVSDQEYKFYQHTTGTEAIIKNMLDAYPFLLEITGINSATFGMNIKFDTPNGQLGTLVHRPYFFGSYIFKNQQTDADYVSEAIETKKEVSYNSVINGQRIKKTFIPITTSTLEEALGPKNDNLGMYVLCLVSDYEQIESSLENEFKTLVTTILILSIASIVLLLIIIRIVGKNRDKAVQQTSQTYTEEVNQMFLNIRGQRHDFLNHVNVIHSFVELGKFDELKNYIEALTGEISTLNDLIKIGQPEIAAIIQAKMVEAINKKIQFIHEFAEISNITTGAKSVDMVRIIGNLLDNAFDEVLNLPLGKRWVECRGWIEGKQFNFAVANPATRTIDEKEKVQIFKVGYSTKDGSHSGIGLAITQNLIAKYRGDIHIDIELDRIKFHVKIPIT